MKERYKLVESLNIRMINNFSEINGLIEDMCGENFTDNELVVHKSNFILCVRTIYSILMEYFKSVMHLDSDVITLEWLKNNVSDDKSYILADEVSERGEESVIVELYERDSYIQPEYIDVLLKLQALVNSTEDFDEYMDFYNSNLKIIIGCAKILLYHSEDLEDLISCENAKLKDCISLEDFVEMLDDVIKEEK